MPKRKQNNNASKYFLAVAVLMIFALFANRASNFGEPTGLAYAKVNEIRADCSNGGCDLNNDGRVTVEDGEMYQSMIDRYDLNDDGVIDNRDVKGLYNCVRGTDRCQ